MKFWFDTLNSPLPQDGTDLYVLAEERFGHRPTSRDMYAVADDLARHAQTMREHAQTCTDPDDVQRYTARANHTDHMADYARGYSASLARAGDHDGDAWTKPLTQHTNR